MTVLASVYRLFQRPMRLLLLLCLVLPAAAFGQQADPRAARLVDNWIKAAGGPGIWDRVHTLQYTITTVWYDSTGAEVRRRPRYVRIKKIPGGFRVRVARTEAVGDYVQSLDGTKVWATLNGTLLPDSARAVREVPYVAGDLVYWMGLPWKLKDPGVNLVYVEPSAVHVSFEGGVGLHDGDRYWHYWADRQAAFPSHVEYIEQGKNENDRERVIWSEWTRFGPAVYAAQRRLVEVATGRLLRAFLISDVKVNEKLPDSLFRQP